ncbi:chitinase [Streptomyces longwoodensis]|uniref:chitinase n=1 Tax=Streptomyces longwoodensis TaxID=68231 RepID=UPI0036FBD77F
MRSFLRPLAGLSCLFALATTGCSGTPEHESREQESQQHQSPTSYAPYVDATEASAHDAAGSPASYNLAFVISDDSACTPRWNGTHAVDDATVASRIGALKKNGARVRVSFGGASGKELAATCDSVPALAEAYGAALDAAGSTQADFDIEGDALTDSASIALRSRAIARLQRERPGLSVTFTLPVMPSGLDADGLALLASANTYDVQVSTVNLMTMNYGESYDGDMGDYAITSATAAHAQLAEVFGTSAAAAWKAMALTSMIGVNDVAGETFTLSDAAQVRTFAEGEGMGWVSMWSAFRDQQCGADASTEDALTTCSGVRQESGAFAKAFSR